MLQPFSHINEHFNRLQLSVEGVKRISLSNKFCPRENSNYEGKKKKTLCESYCGQGKANIKYSFSKPYLKQFILIPRRLYLSPLAGSSMFHGMVGHARSSARLKCSSELGTTDQLSGFSPRSSTAAVCLSVPVCTHAWLRDCVVALTRLSCDYSY